MKFRVNRHTESSLSTIHTESCPKFPIPQTRRPMRECDSLEEAIQAELPWCVRLCPICRPGGRLGCVCQ